MDLVRTFLFPRSHLHLLESNKNLQIYTEYLYILNIYTEYIYIEYLKVEKTKTSWNLYIFLKLNIIN